MGLSNVNAPSNTPFSVCMCSEIMQPFGISNGFICNGKLISAFGENRYTSFIAGSFNNALYSFFAGSNTRNGIRCFFQRDDTIWYIVFVFPDPGTPDINACLGSILIGIFTAYPFSSFPKYRL